MDTQNEKEERRPNVIDEGQVDHVPTGRYEDNVDMEARREHGDYIEETSAELAAPVTMDREDRYADEANGIKEKADNGKMYGYIGVALSLLSLFMLPVLFGATAIILGFIARRKGASGSGMTAITIGTISIVIGLFVLPFF